MVMMKASDSDRVVWLLGNLFRAKRGLLPTGDLALDGLVAPNRVFEPGNDLFLGAGRYVSVNLLIELAAYGSQTYAAVSIDASVRQRAEKLHEVSSRWVLPPSSRHRQLDNRIQA